MFQRVHCNTRDIVKKETQVPGGAEQSTSDHPAPSPHCPLSPGCQLPHLAAHRPGQLPLAERPRGVWRHAATHVGWPECCRQWLAGLVRGACQTQRWTVQPLSASAPSPPQPWFRWWVDAHPSPLLNRNKPASVAEAALAVEQAGVDYALKRQEKKGVSAPKPNDRR